jgi:drug/metabolite transporter (DMT)-like permease
MQALWMVAGAFFFAAMAVCVKVASAWFTSAELVFWRGVFGILLLWGLARRQGVTLGTRYPGMHAWRSLVGVASLGAWFYAIAGLPVGTAITLNYMSSLWVSAFVVGGSIAAWTPREGTASLMRQGPLALAVLAGFAGVVLTLRPTVTQDQLFAGVVGLLSGLVSAFAYMQVMALGKVGEPETRTVLYFAVGTALVGLLATMATGWSPWPGWHGLWLAPMGLFAALGQLCLTRAYSHGATLVVACLQYSGIVFGALFGIVLFDDRLPWYGWAGMALIMASGIAATALRARAVPRAPAEEH